MASVKTRADRSIIKRQVEELKYEAVVANGVDTFKVNCKAHWENRMEDVIRDNKLKTKAGLIQNQQQYSLQERRQRLAMMLSAEQKAYEQELVDIEESPQQRTNMLARTNQVQRTDLSRWENCWMASRASEARLQVKLSAR